MADKKSGPVKPPIIDAKARSAGTTDDTAKSTAAGPRPAGPAASEPAKAEASATPTAKAGPAPASAASSNAKPAAAEPPKPESAKPTNPGTKSPETNRPETPKPDAAKQSAPSGATNIPAGSGPAPVLPLAPLVTTAGAGALIGLALAYGLAAFGIWPGSDNSSATALSDLESRTAGIEDGLGQQQTQSADTTSRIDTLEAELTNRIAELSGATPSTEGLAAQSDLDALSGQIAEFSTRLDALAAGASGDESSQIAGQINAISNDLAALTERLDAIEPQIADIAPAVEDAQARLDDLDARIVDQPAFDAVSADRDRFAQLPAALDALEGAIASGAPFATQLAEIERLLPNLDVEDSARAIAAGGVSTPDALLADFRTAIPTILAARPQDADANWAQSLLDQAASAIALRPTEGDGPQALVGRVETALEAGDLATARQTFAELPEPMQSGAGAFVADLDDAIAAADLLATARATDPASSQPEAAQ